MVRIPHRWYNLGTLAFGPSDQRFAHRRACVLAAKRCWGELMIVKAFGTIDGDVIRLDRPLDLPNASRVEVTISTLDAAASHSRWDRFMDDLERLCDEEPMGSGGKQQTRDELHERR